MEKKDFRREKGITLITFLIIGVCVIIGMLIVGLVIVKSRKSNINESGSTSSSNTSTSMSSEEDNTNSTTVIKAKYGYLLRNEVSPDRREEVIEKLAKSKNVDLKGNLKMICPKYTVSNVYGDQKNNIYDITINENYFLFTAKIEYLTEMYFRVLDTNYEFHTVELRYIQEKDYINLSKYDVTKKDNWDFIYDAEKQEQRGYYKLNYGYFRVTVVKTEKSDDLISKLVDAISIKEKDINEFKITDLWTSIGGRESGYVKLENSFSKIKLSDEYSLDLVSDAEILHWYVADNWNRNEIKFATKDFQQAITIRESLGDYNLEEITNSSTHMDLVPYNYNGEEIQLIYYKSGSEALKLDKLENVFMGFITKIGNRSYTFIYSFEKDESKYIHKGEDPKVKIDYIYNNILKKNVN